MSRQSRIRPATIGVYNTHGFGYTLMCRELKHVIKSDDNINLQSITADHIKDGWLAEKHVIGLVMPGRRGPEYREELGPEGLAAISRETQKGLSIIGVCASSYFLSKEMRWNYALEENGPKQIQSESSLFHGICEGPIMELYDDAYQEKEPLYPRSDNLAPLPASIVTVSFEEKLYDAPRTISIHYGGGGRFHPNQPDQVKVLLRHENTTDRTPAVIEFKHGKGDVLLSNVHPEVVSDRFKYCFCRTPKALSQPDLFKEHVDALAASRSGHDAIVRRFIDNCLQNPLHEKLQRRAAMTYALLVNKQ